LGEAGRMRRVLFVCTGNIFRSLTAEHGLRHALQGRADIHVSSAGTVDFPHLVRRNVRDYLLAKGFDVSRHQRRTLSAAILGESHLVIAMSTDHGSYLREHFGHSAPSFLEACGEAADALPDIEEAVLDYRTNAAAVDAHVRATIDRILSLTPRLAMRLDALLDRVYIPRRP
jgi:protein-tyrosine-phosphatase